MKTTNLTTTLAIWGLPTVLPGESEPKRHSQGASGSVWGASLARRTLYYLLELNKSQVFFEIFECLNYYKCTHNCSCQEASLEREKWVYPHIAFTQTENHIFFCNLLIFVICIDRRMLRAKTGGARKGPKLAYPYTILCFLKNRIFWKIIDFFELWMVGARWDPVTGAPGGGQNWPTLIYLCVFCKRSGGQICQDTRDAKWA